MTDCMNFFLADTTTTGKSGGWVMWAMIALLVVFFWFFIMRPQRKQEKQARDMRASLQVGDEITTIGGIIGKIVSIKDETLVIETTGAATKIRILNTAVRNVDVKAEDALTPAKDKKETK